MADEVEESREWWWQRSALPGRGHGGLVRALAPSEEGTGASEEKAERECLPLPQHERESEQHRGMGQ
jgi:hypothetical protein